MLIVLVLLLNSGLVYRSTAYTVGDRNFSVSEVSYRYANQYSYFANQYGNYASMFGLDTSNGFKGLDKQDCPFTEGSWKDYFLDAAKNDMLQTTALLSYALPFFIGSERIFPSGAAIAGWSGLCDVGGSHNLIVTDRDLFPENCVDIDTIRIFADMPSEKVIAYAGTMIAAAGSGLSPCFAALMERNNCSMRQVEDFEYLPGGGLRGTIDGQSILCGGTELMRLMNVRIPFPACGQDLGAACDRRRALRHLQYEV